MNNSYSYQTDTTFNITNTVQNVPVVLESTSHESQMIHNVTPPITPPNGILDIDIQAMSPNHSLQPTQNFQVSHTYSLTHPQETAVTKKNKYSFFYKPSNDFQMYHIDCEEITLSFELVAWLINNPNPILNDDTYKFYHEQPEIKKIYQVTCKMVPHAFIFQFLNKLIYNIQFTNNEYQQQEFSKVHQENLKFHLKRDLAHYLVPKNVYEDNYNLQKRFLQDYRDYESIMNSNPDSFNQFQQYNANTTPFDQAYTSQEDNNRQLVCLQNDENDGDNYDNQPY